MTQDELDVEKRVCNKKLEELQNKVSYLRAKFLQQRHTAVTARGDSEKATALLEMIKKERESKQWGKMSNVVGKKCGRIVFSVQVPVTDEEGRRTSRECTTQQEIFDTASPVLTARFSGALSSPCYRGRLFNNLGFMGDLECT